MPTHWSTRDQQERETATQDSCVKRTAAVRVDSQMRTSAEFAVPVTAVNCEEIEATGTKPDVEINWRAEVCQQQTSCGSCGTGESEKTGCHCSEQDRHYNSRRTRRDMKRFGRCACQSTKDGSPLSVV